MLKCSILMVTGAAALLAGAAEARPRSPQEQLDRITAGRTPGEPVDCIYLREISSSEIIGNTAIVYRLNNGTIVVNHPTSGANFLNRGDVLVTDTHSSQLCSIDIVRLVDNGTHTPTGSVGLGKFIPYSRAGQGR